jgi:uncharacterized membrane protein YfcA
MDSYIIYLIIGAVGGLLVGLIGGGIGPIVIPALMFTLLRAGVTKDIAVHLAVGTSLCVVLATTTVTIAGYRMSQLINWELFKRIVPGTLIGAMLGSSGSALLSGKILQEVLGVFLILLALIILKNNPCSLEQKAKKELPGQVPLFVSTLLLSGCSTVLGISDGLFLVPFLSQFNFSLRQTIATSTVCAFAASFLGTIPYLVIGIQAKNLPEHTFGYVFVPAFFAIMLTSSLFSPIGVYLNKIVPEKKLKLVFALLMIGAGTKIVLT